MPSNASHPTPVFLWPAGAPGAKGNGVEDRPRLTPYPLEAATPRAGIVICPGGGYGGRAPHEGEPVARWLNGLGLAAFVLDYRVAPYRHPCPLQDAQRALRLVRARAAEWRVDPKRLGILGFSAGGHVAVSAATMHDAGKPDAADPVERHGCRPDCLIACYPVVTFGEFGHQGSAEALLGKPPDEELRRYLSLETRVTRETPPAFIWHTGDDGAVPVENSLLLAQALRRNGVSFALHVFPHGPHGVGLAAEHPVLSAWTRLCREWLEELGFRA